MTCHGCKSEEARERREGEPVVETYIRKANGAVFLFSALSWKKNAVELDRVLGCVTYVGPVRIPSNHERRKKRTYV